MRKLSKLSKAGNEAKRLAERALLLKTLRAHAWNLTHTATALELGDASAVLRLLASLDLVDEYKKHRKPTQFEEPAR